MTVADLLNFFEKIAPLHLQESYDNAGLLTGNVGMEISGVLTCLDSTEEVIQEAIDKKLNVVVAHHPIIFSGLKQLIGSTYIERTIQLAIKNDIAIIAMHTNLDNVYQNGVNQKIADQIGLIDQKILNPKNPEEPEIGSGVIGRLEKPILAFDFLTELKVKMEINCIKYTALVHKTIENVAVAGGSGGFLLQNAINQGAQVFITSDYKYHEFFDANGKIVIADIGHYESEQFTISLLRELINDNFTTFAAHSTLVVTNPVKYL